MHRFLCAVALASLGAVGCDDGTGPDRGSESVDFVMDPVLQLSDTVVVVNGERVFALPPGYGSVRMYRYNHFAFGGLPELGYEQNDRQGEFWGVAATHREPPLVRNDSTILSFLDHGTITLADVEMDKATTIPGVPAGEPLAYENYVSYTVGSYARIIWVGGDTTYFEYQDFHDDMVAGEPIALASSGSAEVNPATGSFSAESVAKLIGMENGDAISLDVDSPPTLSADRSFVLEFDAELDPARAYIILQPFTAVPGARTVFVQPKEATDRVVIPASLLSALVEDAAQERVAYDVIIREFGTGPAALTGTLATAETFELPFAQESETALIVRIER